MPTSKQKKIILKALKRTLKLTGRHNHEVGIMGRIGGEKGIIKAIIIEAIAKLVKVVFWTFLD
jgi:hypothetical protein